MYHLKRVFSILLSCVLFVSPLPLSAIAEELITISEQETAFIKKNPQESYIYMGPESSAFTQLIDELSKYDLNTQSCIHDLNNHIKAGFTTIKYDDAIECITYAESFLQYNQRLSLEQKEQLSLQLEEIIEEVSQGSLTITQELLEAIETKRKNRAFINIATVKGLLSVNDQLVQNITAVDLSVTDSHIQNVTVINDIELPTPGSQIIFAGDTNLYRSAANVLETDDNFIVGTLTPNTVIYTDSTTNQFTSSSTTGTELGYLSGVTSSLQTQINGKVAKAGDTMTGSLQLPAGTAAAPSLTFTGSTTTGLSAATANTLSFSTNAAQRMSISSTGVVSINNLNSTGVVHTNGSGNLSTSLIVDADITNATISNAKLATISSSNTPGAIVVRDGSGNFETNMITIDGTVTNPTDVATKSYVDSVAATGIIAHTPALVVGTSNIALTGLQTIDGVALAVNDRVLLINQTDPVENGLWLAQAGAWIRPADFDTGDTAGQAYVLVTSGNANAGSSYLSNTPTAIIGTDPVQFSLFSLPDVTMGANVGAGTGLVFKNKTGVTLNFRSLIADTHTVITTDTDDITFSVDATPANTASTIVARDASGDFSAGTITANLIGNATTATTATNFTGSLVGDVTGTQGATVVSTIGGQTAANVAAGAVLANAATAANTASTIVRRTATGGFSAGAVSLTDGVVSTALTITPFATAGVVHNNASGLLSSSLIVNADVAPAAGIVDTKLATISTAGKVANSATTATSANTANTIVLRDASGDFAAGIITAYLDGNATTATSSTSFSGSLSGDVTGTQAATVVSTVGGQTAANVAAATVLANAATAANTASTIVRRSAAGGFSTTSISVADEVISSSLTITPFTTAGIVHNDASGLLSTSLIVNDDIDAAAAIVDTKLATISTAGKVANSATTATSANTASTIVLRDASGNFSAGTITANLSGNATTATTATNATNFTGSLSGDVTGTQSATVVSTVGGQTAADVATATVLANAATNLNTADAIVRRDDTGSFAAEIISVVDTVATGNLVFTDAASTSTTGNITKDGSRFIHNYGTNSTFVGLDAGNFSLTGSGNTGFGVNALTSIGSGSSNTAVGSNALFSLTTALGNTAVGNDALIFNQTANYNTALGFSSLRSNTTGSQNTALGSGAMSNNTTGSANTAVGYSTLNNNAGTANTAVGSTALQANTGGSQNVAVGYQALLSNTLGSDNTGIGTGALTFNTTGTNNTAVGSAALVGNTTGSNNSAFGNNTLGVNTIGTNNTGIGCNSLLLNTTGSNNTTLGSSTLSANTTGANNIAIGYQAGGTLATGTGNIYINANAATAAESATIRIGTSQAQCFVAGVSGVGVSGDVVVVDSNGQFGVTLSSARFKHDIKDMAEVSENIHQLRPVTFAYNTDESDTLQYGLIAEEVDQVFPLLVTRDDEGKPYTVKYHLLPALLLNEIQKQRVMIEEMRNTYVTTEEMNAAIARVYEEIQKHSTIIS